MKLTRTDLETLFELLAKRIYEKNTEANEQCKNGDHWIWITEMSLKHLFQLQKKIFDEAERIKKNAE